MNKQVCGCVARARADLDAGVVVVESWDEVCQALDNKKLLLAPYCEQIPCEDLFKKESARCHVTHSHSLTPTHKHTHSHTHTVAHSLTHTLTHPLSQR